MKYTAMNFSSAALLLIDMQCDFVWETGASPIPGTVAVVPEAAALAARFRKQGRPVIHVVRLYKKDGSNADLCRRELIENGAAVVTPYSEGAAIVADLLPAGAAQPDHAALLEGKIVPVAANDYAVYKPRWGAFFGTSLEQFLKDAGVDSLVVAGCNFPNCPRTTIYQASERDFRLGIVPPALSGLYEKGLDELRKIGVNVLPPHLAETFSEEREPVVIQGYRPEWKTRFEQLNKAWLNAYFTVEPVDEYVLTHPEEAILAGGGAILFAACKGQVVGTVALKNLGNGEMELTKMAVDPAAQGLGAGKMLCEAAVALAKERGAERLVLYSQRRLATALAIYGKYGFREIPLKDVKYKRADVMMELELA